MASRYAHLLEPIRELSQNWSIDVAMELEEYLAELDSITISFEDGRQLDFAEAALLIQGSTCVYSKKVEHLYTLVYGTLNHVVEQKHTKGKSSLGDGGEAHLETEQDEEDFLAVDDELAEVENISLPPPKSGTAGCPPGFTLISAAPPLASDAMACKMDAHASGALLLPHLHVPAHILSTLPCPTRTANAAVAEADVAAALVTADETAEDLAAEVDNVLDDDEPSDSGYGDAGGWEEALEIVAMETGSADVAAAGELGEPDMCGAQEEDDTSTTSLPPASPLPGSARPTVVGGRGDGAGLRASSDDAFDPWKPLDPHDPTGGVLRPFRRGKTWSVPRQEETRWAEGEEAEVNCATADEDDKENGSTKAGGATYGVGADVLRRLGLLSPTSAATGTPATTTGSSALRAPLWPQFESLHAAAAKRRQEARKLQRQAAALRSHVASADANATEIEGDALLAPVGDGGGAGGGMDSDVGGGAVDVGGGDFGGLVGGDSAGGGAEDADGFLFDEDGPAGFDMHDDEPGAEHLATTAPAAEELAHGQMAAVDVAGGSSRGSGLSYEEMCRRHVEACLEASSSYREDVELQRRVAEWQVKVEPYLRVEQRREAFDMVRYTDRLLEAFDNNAGKTVASEQSTLSFSDAAQCSQPYDVCRMFLASLMLSNSGNVELQASGSVETGEMQLTVNLLERTRRKIDVE